MIIYYHFFSGSNLINTGFSIMNLLFATRNIHKAYEVVEVLKKKLAIPHIFTLQDFPSFPDFVEDGVSFSEISAGKATYYSKCLLNTGRKGWYVLSEDSGLEVFLLDSYPGIRSNRIAETDRDRIRIVLEKLNEVDKNNTLTPVDVLEGVDMKIWQGITRPSRAARFVSAMSIAKDEELLFTAIGEVNGFITFQFMGENGFGYDPIFFYPKAGKTFGQMSREEKMHVSHRARALEKVIAFLEPLCLGESRQSQFSFIG